MIMKSIGIVLFDGFPMMSLSCITEPLRVANRENHHPVFEWKMITEHGQPVSSSSNIKLSVDHCFNSDFQPDILLVLTSYYPEKTVTKSSIEFLRKHATRNILMGCVDTGALLFAKSGLLKNRKAAVHHESLKALRDPYAANVFVDLLFDFSETFCSSAGGVATLDMTLALIAYFNGKTLAAAVAKAINYRPLASTFSQLELGKDWSVSRLDKRLADAIQIMLENIDEPVPISNIATQLELEGWQLRRKFQKYFGATPARYYLNLRLENARALLKNSQKSVGDIGIQCGFSNIESLSRSYKTRFGIQPSKDRDY